MVRPAALAAHASSGGTLLHTDRQQHGGSNAPTRKGVRGLELRRLETYYFKFCL
jgi:hypothetical protein